MHGVTIKIAICGFTKRLSKSFALFTFRLISSSNSEKGVLNRRFGVFREVIMSIAVLRDVT